MIEMLSALARGTPSVTAVESMVNAHEIAVSKWKSMCSSSMWGKHEHAPIPQVVEEIRARETHHVSVHSRVVLGVSQVLKVSYYPCMAAVSDACSTLADRSNLYPTLAL